MSRTPKALIVRTMADAKKAKLHQLTVWDRPDADMFVGPNDRPQLMQYGDWCAAEAQRIMRHGDRYAVVLHATIVDAHHTPQPSVSLWVDPVAVKRDWQREA